MGCRRDSCRLMQLIHAKGRPQTTAWKPSEARRPAEPYAQVLRALLRAGWTLRELANRADYSAPAFRNIALGMTSFVYADTASAIERLVAQLPSEAKAQLA